MIRTFERPSWLATHSPRTMRAGAVLFHAPSSVFQAPGGGENQLIQTGTALEALGVEVRLFCPWSDRLEEARLLHLFGMSREGLELARVAQARGVRVVLAPICWIEPRALAAQTAGPLQRAWTLVKWRFKAAAPRWPCWRRELLSLADAVLPNSQAEARQLVHYFGVAEKTIHVVPNGVAPHFAEGDRARFAEVYGPRDFVLFVGRVEPRKNVRGLIDALRPSGLPLVVIGDPPPGCAGYARACREAGGASVRWISSLDHDDPLLASAYTAARVFALPSWFETPGLAALEAALAGAAVVLTPHGCTREYFGNRVEYARPDHPAEIRRAVARAWATGPDLRLARHVSEHFSWSVVARRTAEVYDQVVGQVSTCRLDSRRSAG